MTPRSAKNKGKKLQVEVQNKLREIGKNFDLVDGDINNAIMGESGADIKLSPAAKKIIPFDIECKNTENFNRNSAIKQAEENSIKSRIPLIIFKKNRSKTYAILSYNDLYNLIEHKISEDKIFNKLVITKQSFNIWVVLKHTESNTKEGRIPLLIFSRNSAKTYATLEFDKLLELLFKK